MSVGQQFAAPNGSSQHQPGIGGPMQMNYQGQAHAGTQQQPRNPMGQFASRDGAMNMDYQQGIVTSGPRSSESQQLHF